MNAHDEMSDADVLRTASDCLTVMPVPSPPDAQLIIARGSMRRRRRWIPAVVGTLAVVAGAALAIATLLSGNQASHSVTVKLAAWTVSRQPGGNITVTFREMEDLSGLQHTLRVDGVPVSVTYFNQQNSACRPYPYHPGEDRSEASRQTLIGLPSGHAPVIQAALRPGNSVIIDPSALPHGVGLQLGLGPWQHNIFRIWAGLVQLSQQCTGS